MLSSSSVNQPPGTSKEWAKLQRLHSLVQERTCRYVEQLTGRKDYLEQYVAVLTAMLDSVGDGLIVCDADGELAFINEAAEKLVGTDIPTRVGGSWADDFGLFYSDAVTRIEEKDQPMRQALQGLTVETVFFVRASNFPDGAWFRVHATPVYDKSGTLHGAIAVFHDITETRRASRQRDALSALITHDLKNHLIGESRLLQLLLDDQLGSLNEQQRDIIIRIKQDSKRQLQITKGLVEIFRYDVHTEEVLHFVDTEIKTLIAACAEELLPSTVINGLTLDIDHEDNLPLVSVDEQALRHVVMNILGNALKYTPSGGCLKIETRNLGHEVSIAISDTGAGIPAADLRLLFTDSWTGSSRYGATPDSTGLGLFLCAKIVSAHNGRITCSSQLSAGTQFTLFLPTVQATNSAALSSAKN